MKLNGKLTDDPLISKRVAQYVALRQTVRDLEDEIKQYKAAMEKVAAVMLDFLQTTGQEMARTTEGTVYIRSTTTASLSDPDGFMEFVKANNAFELMDRRANATACREFSETHGSLPPGVRLNQGMTVGVRSPGEKDS